MLSESPSTKKTRSQGPKAPRSSICYSVCPAMWIQMCGSGEIMYEVNKEEAAEHAKLWVKRVGEAKGTHISHTHTHPYLPTSRNGLLKNTGCPHWELLLLSPSPAKTKSLWMSNKQADLEKQKLNPLELASHMAKRPVPRKADLKPRWRDRRTNYSLNEIICLPSQNPHSLCSCLWGTAM